MAKFPYILKKYSDNKESTLAIYGLLDKFAVSYIAHSQFSNAAMGTDRVALWLLCLICSGWKMGRKVGEKMDRRENSTKWQVIYIHGKACTGEVWKRRGVGCR